jgi:hypothetical protein
LWVGRRTGGASKDVLQQPGSILMDASKAASRPPQHEGAVRVRTLQSDAIEDGDFTSTPKAHRAGNHGSNRP